MYQSKDNIIIDEVDTLVGYPLDSLSLLGSENLRSDSILAFTDSLSVAETIDVEESEPQKIEAFTSLNPKEGVSLPVMLSGSDGLFALVFACFMLLSFSFREIASFLKENVLLAFSSTKAEKLSEKTVTSKERFNLYLLVFTFILILSISSYVVVDRFYPIVKDYGQLLSTIGTFILVLTVFIILKLLVNKLVGYIFEIEKRTGIWNFSYLILFSALGGSCFVPVLLLIYSKVQFDIIIAFMLILFLIVQLSIIFRVVSYFRDQKFSIMFLIAYLCTVEIIPYIFLGIGMVYLYKVDIFNTVL